MRNARNRKVYVICIRIIMKREISKGKKYVFYILGKNIDTFS